MYIANDQDQSLCLGFLLARIKRVAGIARKHSSIVSSLMQLHME